jgi:papain like protease
MAPFLGRVPSPADDRDFSLRSLVAPEALAAIELPRAFSNRTLKRVYRDRFDQQESSCVGQSLALAKIVHERRDMRRHYAIDPLWIWRRSKMLDGIGHPGADRGTYIRTALGVLLHEGARVAKPGLPEPAFDEQAAESRFAIGSYFRLHTVEEIKAAIFLFGPVVLGTEWYDSWFDPAENGMLPSPAFDHSVGGHATLAYGWDDRIPTGWMEGDPPMQAFGAFRVANSWGRSWGDDGDFWMPYAALDQTPDFEAWKSIDVTTGKV